MPWIVNHAKQFLLGLNQMIYKLFMQPLLTTHAYSRWTITLSSLYPLESNYLFHICNGSALALTRNWSIHFNVFLEGLRGFRVCRVQADCSQTAAMVQILTQSLASGMSQREGRVRSISKKCDRVLWGTSLMGIEEHLLAIVFYTSDWNAEMCRSLRKPLVKTKA